MRLYRLTAIILGLGLAASCDDESPSKTTLLTGDGSKGWMLTGLTPESRYPDCRATAERHLDNTWTFYADGTVTFDHGAIIGGEDCEDIPNYSGLWSLKDDETVLELKYYYEGSDHAGDFDRVSTGKLRSITAKTFVWENDGVATFTAR